MSAACDFFEKCFYKKDRIYLKEMHKMKNMKKIAAGVLSLFMAVSSLGVNAFADDSDDYDIVFVQEDDIDEDDIFGSDSFFDDFGWYYDYDEEYDEYDCMMDLDEDEVYRILSSQSQRCPYYRQGDDYTLARRQ